MKRYLIRLGLVLAIIFTSQCLAGDDMKSHKISKKEKRELREEQEKLEKQRKKEEKLHKKEMKKLEEQQEQQRAAMECEKRKEEKLRKKEMQKLEEQQAQQRTAMEREKRKEKRKEDAAKKKEEARIAEEERKLHKEFEKEHKQKINELNGISREEKLRMKELDKEKRAQEKRERRHLKAQKREEEMHLASLQEKTSLEEKEAKKETEKAEATRLTQNWKNSREVAVANDYKEGKYSDVYMLPAWPFSNWFFNEKAMLNVNATYWYAIDSYDTNGASHNITNLAFGEPATITLQDILLASKLYAAETVAPLTEPDVLASFIYDFPTNHIAFTGKAEKYGLEFDFARHVLRDDITIGVQVPVLYLRNHLDTCMSFPTSTDNKNFTDDAEAISLDYKEILHRILQSKGINELGGSATGLGDITLFGNVEVTTKYVEKIVLGFKVGLPTGKEDTPYKLFSPSLSANDKCAEFAVFASMLLDYNRYVNPHLTLQASFFSTSHVHKRVPHKVSSPTNASIGDEVGNALMAMGDRILYKNNGTGTDTAFSFSDWDTTIRGFADHPVSLKFEKGTEFHVRLGNVFNKFLSRRGFFDIYYDLRAKLEDNFRGLDVDTYDIQKMKTYTKSVENRIGMEYSHQYDSRTRLKATLNYSFAGTNAPKVFDIGCSLGHSF